MAQTRVLPVLPLDDAVVLPGMVVSVDLSDEATRASIDAARAGGTAGSADARAPGISSRPAPRPAEVLLVPRVDGEFAQVAAVGVIEQVGRLPRGGGSAAVVRGTA
ncbi:LON peptidase substrate-binding domain-containing protein, partial [Frankia sp. AgKG'84/4]|uniref:LON peptidase substrate-binding domain-containing protein n=1 Tax=Frankia sp. AgKG'84/4 TaxID=573490 RepID=UPI002029BFDD